MLSETSATVLPPSPKLLNADGILQRLKPIGLEGVP